MIIQLKSKIHRATVTDANVNYEGSITIYKELMKQAHIYEFEKVTVVDVNNGQRFETYVIKGEDPENTICINGAAARLVSVGDKVIIMSYMIVNQDHTVDDGDDTLYQPYILLLDDDNHIK
jgi:aspartate 1-decarboxylase